MTDQSQTTVISKNHPVAYFCAEFGFDTHVPLYAGGLGVLAGDTLKQADDEQFPLVGIGLLYRGHRSQQAISPQGMQEDYNDIFDPLERGIEHVYVDDQPLFIKVHLSQLNIWLRCWRKVFPNGLELYLLDPETEQNYMTERSLTQELYSGTAEAQLKQQLLLGIGGVKLLTEIGIYPSVYHVQEGRPAFLHWQLIRQLMDHHAIDYESARKLAVQKTVYTNHTLVAAGNKGYPCQLLAVYAEYYAKKMNISVDYLLAPGMEDDGNTFSMTRFALNTSRRSSGVSQLHTKLSEQEWPGYQWVAATNGVHLPTWQDSRLSNHETLSERDLWKTHLQIKSETRDYVQKLTGFGYDSNQLVLGWARRLTGYKQLTSLFADVSRLKRILFSVDRPVQLLVAGKAHQGDSEAKEMLRQIIHLMQTELAGQVLFVPNYSIEVAQQLVKGVDVWLNTPQMGREASGTSGMKAISNGVLQCTVADGWAAEVKWNDTGWVLNHQSLSESLYSTLESAIIPLYYHTEEEYPKSWVEMMRRSLALSQQFTTKRMLEEYRQKLYI